MSIDIAKLNRTQPPIVEKSKDVKFPHYYEETLTNGIKIFVVEDNRIPLVSVKFVLKAGAYDDLSFGEDASGLASLTSDLLVKGTSKMNAVQVAEIIDFHGASINTACEYDASYLLLTSLKNYFDKLFDIASDLFLNPVFLDEEIEREKQQISNSLLAYVDEGSFLSERGFKKNVYLNSPYKLNIEGKISTVNKFHRANIKEFYDKFYIPENLIIAIVGDIKSTEAASLIKLKFNDWNKKKTFNRLIYKDDSFSSSKVVAIEKKGAVQSEVTLGHLGVQRNSPDYFPLIVMNTLLGGYFTSRINKNLREVNGYTYGARSGFNFRKHSGDFSVDTSVENSLTYDAVKEIIFELNKMKNEYATAEELDSVKNYLTGSFPLQLETPNAIANKIINLDLYNIEKDYYDTFISKINSVTLDDVKKVSEKYLHPDNLVISVAGKVDIIKQTMEQIAETIVIKNTEEL